MPRWLLYGMPQDLVGGHSQIRAHHPTACEGVVSLGAGPPCSSWQGWRCWFLARTPHVATSASGARVVGGAQTKKEKNMKRETQVTFAAL
ncbi:hypothetical protein GGTG_06937 [Gaeumannomyces tritici R3-111a-1]|uniref:Uncharacterized protein n=1 Tax=Gaeumannomyces tritici (strain R3-111a-1) TaxID=644352 RepID=J3P090_GAET3|nr:hypothetical protein GGTG_06937 [Gaeumannomyces tritici R3-111a-1]EJT77023.1 hypothetical protein GGTG_06937 [Gaeumannomyces tritici R3-111a-1]